MPRIGPFVAALAALCLISGAFYVRQNSGAQIGGTISVPKILWLNYTIAAWFILSFFLARSPLLAPAIRRVFAAHLLNFSARAVIELYLLYVTVSWSPVYGIAHDLFSIALITALARETRPQNDADRAALHFTWSLRATLVCEIGFAAVFHRLTSGEHAIYFAGTDPRFHAVNMATVIVVTAAYTDLAWVLSRLHKPLEETADA